MNEYHFLKGKTLNNICRTCLMEGELVPIFEDCKFPHECLAEMIATCTLIECSEKDLLPKYVCSECVQEIHSSYSFARKCEKSDKILRQYLKNLTYTKSDKNSESNEDNKSAEDERVIDENGDLENTEYLNESFCYTTTDKNIDDQLITNENVKEIIYAGGNSENSIILNYNEVMLNEQGLMLTDNYELTDIKNNLQENDSQIIIPNEFSDYQINSEYTDNLDVGIEQIDSNSAIDIKSHECKKCLKSFYTFRELKMHRKSVEHFQTCNIKLKCTICAKLINYQYYKKHFNSHSVEKEWCCHICETKFRYEKNLDRHLQTHTKIFKCNQCEKEFFKCQTFEQHLKMHKNKVRLPKPAAVPQHQTCEICNKNFPTKPGLKQHLLIHGDKNFLCSYCGKKCSTLSTLSVHTKTHTGVKTHKCTFCSKSFTQSSTLKIHMLLHSGIKPYRCEICDKTFRQRHHLKYHTFQHTGEKAYPCLFCGKRFSYSGTLRIHIRSHTGYMPYSCSICGKRFYDSSNMKKHEKIHL